ncbi:putative late blight resistance protein homolog R1B-16 [Salvia miltiorrhiza]|uniref:putative late blight resistance protein homolog R1B-16 n=1 Tax=Salvia miltiorrhiza TaxID=226208 RepID=UPI0025AD4F14|nr:putative late blight resistance protein homolog R1B-16 [Salvia miltiorrhiza]
MSYEALDNLKQTLDLILEYRDDLLTHSVKQEILSIRIQAAVLQLNLKLYPNKEKIREAANTAYEIIEYFFFGEYLSDCGSTEPTIILANKLREVAQRLESTVGDVVDYIKGKGVTDSPAVSSSSRSAITSSKDDFVVGVDKDVKVIKDRLLVESSRDSRLRVLPIVGRGGIGKTTLAKIVYNDALVRQEFSICGWVTISQDYNIGTIALHLLASIKGMSADRNIPIDSLIREYLHNNKYLIIVDDICSKKAWDEVKMLFPENDNGSRIIVTTRLQDVAAYVRYSTSIHMMRLLDAHDSWSLLKQKVFGDEDFPIELEDIGTKIAKGCGGLPLAILLVAGILSKILKTRNLWKKIAANDTQLETIICLSYNHLPNHLKPCFLYIAGFPEDQEIRVTELVNLWISEGFVTSSSGSKSLEEEAEDYLEDLVERSLVLITNRKFDGKIKSCSVHDIVREFCVRQAAKEKVILSIIDYLPTPILRKHFVPHLIKDHHSISASSYDLHLKDYMHSSHVRTIICIPEKGYRSEGVVEKFSALRVLHVLRRNNHWDWQPGHVFDLVHLTYLASNIPNSIVPSAISKLQNLQTLIIYRSEVRLPMEIWRLRQLRHLIAFSFQPLPYPEGENNPLDNLQELSLATDLVCSKRMVEMIPHIKKLGICYSKEKFDLDARYCLNNLKYLCWLEKLKLEMHGDFSCIEPESDMRADGGFSFRGLNFPLQLRRLTLSGWMLSWSDVTIIGSLPNLQVLKLRNYACKGQHWETIEGEFRELRYLLIDGSYLVEWTTESSHFPKLECLMLRECRGLHEIPSNIGDIPTLKLIEVRDKLHQQKMYNYNPLMLKFLPVISKNHVCQVTIESTALNLDAHDQAAAPETLMTYIVIPFAWPFVSSFYPTSVSVSGPENKRLETTSMWKGRFRLAISP